MRPLWEIEVSPSYAVAYYPRLDGSCQSYHSWDQTVSLSAGATVLPILDVDCLMDFFKSRERRFGLQSVAARGRYLWLNDVAGDKVTLTTNLVLRYVPSGNFKDPSCPYHALLSGELGLGLGKEFAHLFHWRSRLYALAAAGMGNTRCGWYRLVGGGKMHFPMQRSVLALELETYNGFGSERKIDLNNFQGYGKLAHHSLDIQLMYSWEISVWGSMEVAAKYRVYASVFPEQLFQIMLSYRLPFSPF